MPQDSPSFTPLSFFLRYARPEFPRLLLLLLATLAATGAALATPQIVRGFLDQAKAQAPFPSLIGLALLFMALALFEQALAVARFYLGELVAWRATNRLREDLAAHCLRLDMDFHKTHKPGELLERVDNDVNETRGFFSTLFTEIASSALLLVGVVVALALEDWRLGAGALLLTVLAGFVFPRVNRVRTPLLARIREVQAQLTGDIQELIQGREDIQGSSASAVMLNRLHRRYGERYRASMALLPVNTLANILPSLVLVLAYALAYTLSSGFLGAVVSVSGLAMVILYLEKLRDPIQVLRWSFETLATAEASLGRISALLRERPRLSFGEASLEAGRPLALRVEELSFGYDETEVLRGVSLELAPGEVLGLLGRTGSGKTTLARLVMHLYEPRRGRVLLGDGGAWRELRELAPGVQDGLMAMVTQEVELFNASIRDNLSFFDPLVPDSALREALERVRMDEWLARQARGLDTRLAGAAGLSAGEAQLLSIARVFLRNPSFVVLDEASSRLDPATERRLEEAISELLRGRSAILIAHRLETLARADQVAILDRGELVEAGRRTELLADPESRFSTLLRLGAAEALA